MDRRDFLKYSAGLFISVAFGKTPSHASWLSVERRCGFPMGMLLIDGHAHPDIFPCTPYFCDQASMIDKIKQIGMNASCFAVTGDYGQGEREDYLFSQIVDRLLEVKGFEDEGRIKIVRRIEDIPDYAPPAEFTPGAILSLEGAIPLIKDEDGTAIDDFNEVRSRIDFLYELGVRMITLMHFWSNELGSVMTDQTLDPDSTEAGRLTPLGQAIVERMMELGMIVDVAHAYRYTLRDITEIARIHNVPIIDSHTALTHTVASGSRRRPIDEMEWIAQTRGVVCTWPVQACSSQGCHRTTFAAWAEESVEISRAIGVEHIGLGTDGGGIGNLATLINGYESILDLPKLVNGMDDAGFKRREIAAYMGSNLFRVMKQCIG